MATDAPESPIDAADLLSLSAILWRERVALDRLADLLLMGDSDRSTEPVYQSISELELHRAIAVREVTEALGLDLDATLRHVIAAVARPWTDVLRSHRRALVDLTNEVTRLARRPVVDLSDRPLLLGDFGVSGVRRFGVQGSLRDFLR